MIAPVPPAADKDGTGTGPGTDTGLGTVIPFPVPSRPEAPTTLPAATSGRDNLAGANLPFPPCGNRSGLLSEPAPGSSRHRVPHRHAPLHVLISYPPHQPLDPDRRAALEWASRHRDAFDRAGILVGLFGVAWMIGRSLPSILSFVFY